MSEEKSDIRELLDELQRETWIALELSDVEPSHGMMQRQEGNYRGVLELNGKFRFWRPLMAPQIFASLTDDKLNPVEIANLAGFFRVHFLEPADFAKLDAAGTIDFNPSGPAPMSAEHSLALHLFLPTHAFDLTRTAKAVVCTVYGVEHDDPASEFSAIYWFNAPRKSLKVTRSQFQQATPRESRAH